MLTHYCAARNQPRLEATEISEDGATIRFTYRDATGIATRDEGHMDQALIRILDGGRFSSKWSWYADGEESWMEDITYAMKR